jgi:tRNA A37 threonylcarbamoyltransferase TsaD
LTGGGAALEKHAREGNPKRFALPIPLRKMSGCDFSFSGLKTAARRTFERLQAESFFFLSLQQQQALQDKALELNRQALKRSANPAKGALPQACELVQLSVSLRLFFSSTVYVWPNVSNQKKQKKWYICE